MTDQQLNKDHIEAEEKKSVFTKVLDVIGGSFGPILGVLAGSGLLSALLAVFLKTKDKDLKTLSASAIVPGLLAGTTELINYGILLRFKRTMVYVAVAKRAKKHDADQKNKQEFDSSKTDSEFSTEFGSANANQAHKNKAKKEKASKNEGQWKGMH